MRRPELTAFAAVDAGSRDGACPRAGDRGDPLRALSGWDEADRRTLGAGAAAGLARRRIVRRLHRGPAGMVIAPLNGTIARIWLAGRFSRNLAANPARSMRRP